MRKFVILAFLMLSGVIAFTQKRTVTGSVKDETGSPVPFATVSETGTKNATTADASGSFVIKMRGEGSLSFSATGYSPTVATPTGNALAVTVKRNSTELTTVVVTTAFGQVRQSKELGYSTAKVSNSELVQAKPISVANGLTGKVSGLQVNTINAGLFAPTRITLRGNNL